MDKYKDERGYIAVLFSAGKGVSWSQYNSVANGISEEFLAMDRTLVEMHFSGADTETVWDYIKEVTGKDTNMMGWENTVVEWVPEGTQFMITEYDGFEVLVRPEHLTITA